MDAKIIFGVVVFAIIILIAGLLIPGGERTPPQTFPWQIEVTPDGKTKVFGLILGKSTLQQAEQAFQESAEISLFESPKESRPHMVEGYFDKVTLGGLSARIIVVMDIPVQQLQAIYQRGNRISTLGDGRRKVSLHTEDQRQVRVAPIASMTYLPRVALKRPVLEKRFGKPVQIINEKNNTATHWLYPDKGLDVALDDQGNAVLQYVAPSNFAQLIDPLQRN